MEYIALDIGGTSVKSAVVVVAPVGAATVVKLFTARPYKTASLEAMKISVVKALEEASTCSYSKQIAIATTGAVDADGCVLSTSMEWYRRFSWSDFLQANDSWGSVYVNNDGHCSAWAEYASLEIRTERHLHVVVGTGVGGGLILNGKLLSGFDAGAGRLGHSFTGNEPGLGTATDQLASWKAIVAYFNQSSRRDAQHLEEVTELAVAQDSDARAAFTKAGRYLGVALGAAVNLVNPQSVSLGGGVVEAATSIEQAVGVVEQQTSKGGFIHSGNPYLAGINEGLQSVALPRMVERASYKLGRYGNKAGLLGAASLSALDALPSAASLSALDA